MDKISGSCLCGEVTFECDNDFQHFHFCHCVQCRKASGSAHASNLFTAPNNITWLSGGELIKRYDVPGRTITNAFCNGCGSSVPYLSGSGKSLVVPAGGLDGEPNMQPQDNLFWCERADWYDVGLKTPRFSQFPE